MQRLSTDHSAIPPYIRTCPSTLLRFASAFIASFCRYLLRHGMYPASAFSLSPWRGGGVFPSLSSLQLIPRFTPAASYVPSYPFLYDPDQLLLLIFSCPAKTSCRSFCYNRRSHFYQYVDDHPSFFSSSPLSVVPLHTSVGVVMYVWICVDGCRSFCSTRRPAS